MTSPDYCGQLLDEKYRLKQIIGQGGMGVVYLGEHQLIGRPVAVKFLHTTLTGNKDVIKRFYREARAAAAIRHKNIIDILDIGVSANGEPYLVMEYLEGENLSSLLLRDTRLDLSTAVGIMESALLALEAAHGCGIVHRDLKPDNIFLVRQSQPAPAEIKLIDFGISKNKRDQEMTQLTQDGSLLGTPAYMSPEQARGSIEVDHQSDIYAMGVIFYEMLTGQKPFIGKQYNELLLSILTEEPRHPATVFPQFPGAAWPIIQRALIKDPADRYQSAGEMLVQIRALAPIDKRLNGLTQLAGTIAANVAGGDLGQKNADSDNPNLAADLLSEMSEITPLPSERPWVARLFASAGFKKLSTPRRRSYWLGGLVMGLVAVFALTLVGPCEGDPPEGVLLTVTGARKKAKIFYNDSLVLENPFRVDKGATLVPLRVETPGRKNIKISVTPTHDQIIDVLKKKVHPAPKDQSDSAKTVPRTGDTAITPSTPTSDRRVTPPNRPSKSANSAKKNNTKTQKRRRNPFRRLINGVRSKVGKKKTKNTSEKTP